MSEQVAIAVLCGGRSARFGSDKAIAHFRGGTLLSKTLEVAQKVSDTVYLLGELRTQQEVPEPVIQLRDRSDFQGPKAGIEALCTSLAASGCDESKPVLLLALDYPGLNLETLQYLIGHWSEGDCALLLESHKPQYLFGMYRYSVLEKMLEVSVNSIFRSLQEIDIEPRLLGQGHFSNSEWKAATANVNTLGDWTEWKKGQSQI